MNRILYFIVIFVVLAAAIPAFTATRFYLPSSGAAEVLPSLTNLGWGDTTSAAPDQIRMRQRNISYTAFANKTATFNVQNSILYRQYVSDPIAGQTISGTLQGQIRASQGKACTTEVGVYLVDNRGTYKSTLLSLKTGVSAVAAALTNRYIPAPGTALTSQTSVNGDRIVIEIGMNRTGAGNGASALECGDVAITDQTSDETSTNQYNPWVEFSQDILFPSVTMIE